MTFVHFWMPQALGANLLRLTAMDQMRQAGVTITSGAAAFVEMLHDNAGSIAGELYAALDLPATRHIIQITQGQVGPELIRLRVWPRRGRGMNLDEGLEHALAGCTSDQG